ncbi:MAG: cyclic nucleotide-binding domain-containing protein [Desulfofustis sp.]
MSSSTATTTENQNVCRLTKDFELLRHSPLFSGLHLDVVKLFAYLSNRRTFQPGDLLIQQGDKAEKAYILNDGEVELLVLHRGSEVVLQRLTRDDFFGELALLAQFNWFFSVRAVTVCDALVINRAVFKKVLEKYPGHKDGLIERVIQLRIDRLINQTSFMLDKLMPADITATQPLI